MRTLNNKKILFVLVSFFFSFSIIQAETIQQIAATNFLGGQHGDGVSEDVLGQSFRPSVNGSVTSVSVAVSGSTTIDLRFYSGETDCRLPGAATLLDSHLGESISGTATAGDVSSSMTTITTNAPVSNSQAYTFCIYDSSRSLNLGFSTTDYYGGGQLYNGGKSGTGGWETTMDLAFIVEVTENSLATGQPTISGTTTVGETLTADTSAIADADGLGTFSYQWKAGGVDIAGATSDTYTLTSNEEGDAITVVVSFTDGNGNAESVTSNATAAVAAAPTEEDSAPALDGGAVGDGNGDGTADSTQDYVHSTNTSIGWVTAATANDGSRSITVTQIASNGDVSGVSVPYGKFAVNIFNLAVAGSTAPIDLYVPYDASIDRLYKLNRVSGNYEIIFSTITHYPGDNKTKITYNVRDGSDYDQDGAADGDIADPVIPAGPGGGGSANAPFTPFALLTLLGSIGLIGFFSRRFI